MFTLRGKAEKSLSNKVTMLVSLRVVQTDTNQTPDIEGASADPHLLGRCGYSGSKPNLSLLPSKEHLPEKTQQLTVTYENV